MKTIKVSVGIPAYNEEKNISRLIGKILTQKEIGFKLLEIIVISDGSTDKTAALVRSIGNRRIKFFDDGKRLGQAARQNQMIAKFKGDVLVLAEADTVPSNNLTLAHLIKPYLDFKNKKIGMVVGRDLVENPKTFFEGVFACGNEMKQRVFDEWKGGDNLYNSGGHTMRAVSRSYASKLFFPSDAPEDCYSYLRLKELGFLMVRAKEARILAKNIKTVGDRFSHSEKFYRGKLALYKYFDNQFVDCEYDFSKILLVKYLLLGFLKSPIYTAFAVLGFVVNYSKFADLDIKFNFKLRELSFFERV